MTRYAKPGKRTLSKGVKLLNPKVQTNEKKFKLILTHLYRGLCKVRMRTADKTNDKNQNNFKKYRNRYKNKNNQLTVKKEKDMSKYPRELVVYISIIKMTIINSHAALRLFWRLVNHVNQSNVIKRSVLSVYKICSAFRFCIYLYCGFVCEDKRRSWRKQTWETAPK